MANVFDTLQERGFIAQCTNEAELRELFDKERVTFYIGFDPTADSLHAGHFIALMAMAHMQRAGHRPICLVGGGTGTVGDPSGRTDMRRMLTDEDIEHNCECFKKQIARFIDFSDDKAIMVNNGDWLRKLNYIDLLREVGACFTVNRMLAADCYKQRWEKGLTFLEFNYMVMQGYDFLELNRRYGCKLEMGGDDQWSNIIAGVELNRRKNNTAVYGLTNKLLTKSDGKKMGKTAGGALWLDAEKTSPYEFYQYWRNVDDADVENCLALLTFLPMDEVRRLGALKDAAINEAKKVLAYEVTKIVHGEEEAVKAAEAASALFGSGSMSGNIPTLSISASDLAEDARVSTMLVKSGLCKSQSDARAQIAQNAVSLNGEKITDPASGIQADQLRDGAVLKKGKKGICRIVLK